MKTSLTIATLMFSLIVSAQDLEINKENFIKNVCTGDDWEVIKMTSYSDTNPNGVSLDNKQYLKMRGDLFVINLQKDGKFKADPNINGVLVETINGNAWKYNKENNSLEIWQDEEKTGELPITWLTSVYFSFKVTNPKLKDYKVFMFGKVGR
jgi:triacylglycerol esterase/lipase EstA (alpha/beta hydrolase family)